MLLGLQAHSNTPGLKVTSEEREIGWEDGRQEVIAAPRVWWQA